MPKAKTTEILSERRTLRMKSYVKLSCDSRFQRAFTWFDPTSIISLKTQPHAVNACVKCSSQRSFCASTCISTHDQFWGPQSLAHCICRNLSIRRYSLIQNFLALFFELWKMGGVGEWRLLTDLNLHARVEVMYAAKPNFLTVTTKINWKKKEVEEIKWI